MNQPGGTILDFNNALQARELEAYLKSDEHDAGRVERIRTQLNACAESFIAWLFPAAVFDRRCAKIGNTHGDPGFSLTIETKGGKAGVWKDFGNPDQKGGDLIGLYMAARSVSFPNALEELADWLGKGTRPEVNYQRQQLVAKAKRVERDLGPPRGEWHYTDADGVIIASVYRFEPDAGGKEYLPRDVVRGVWGNPPVRPLYNLPGILKSQQVVFCEGEKAAQALIDLGITATSVMGGANSPLDKTDLEPLRGKDVVIWPDADKPGFIFATTLTGILKDVCSSVSMAAVPEDVEQGWDAADAIAEGLEIEPILRNEENIRPQPVLPFFWFDEAQPNLEANDFIEGLFTTGAMSVVYGPSNCGKTFFILDLALHVAWGREWRGRTIDKGAIVYLSLEGAAGIRNRIAAFRKHYGIDQWLPFVAMPKPVNLLDDAADVAAVVQLVEHIAVVTNQPVRMVIIDTLSRAMAGGDESSSKDMTALIGNCDAVRSATGAHVCIVHHSGKDEAKGARGHSSLRAATDTEIEIKRDPEMTFSTVKVTKQRDLEAGEPFVFTLQPVALGTNRRDKEVTSCIVMEADKAVLLGRQQSNLSPKEMEAMGCLMALCEDASVDPETGEIYSDYPAVPLHVWKDALVARGTLNGNNHAVAKTQFNRLRNSLLTKQKIELRDGLVWQKVT